MPCRRSTLCPFQSPLGAFSTLQVTYRGVLERLCCWEAAFWHLTSRYGAIPAPHIALEPEPPCLPTGFTGNKGVNVISLRIDVARSASGRWNDGVSTVGIIYRRLNSSPPPTHLTHVHRTAWVRAVVGPQGAPRPTSQQYMTEPPPGGLFSGSCVIGACLA